MTEKMEDILFLKQLLFNVTINNKTLITKETHMTTNTNILGDITFNIDKYNEILKEYIKNDRNVNIIEPISKRTLLMISAGLGLFFPNLPTAANIKGVELLIDSSANVNCKDSQGCVAADYAKKMLKFGNFDWKRIGGRDFLNSAEEIDKLRESYVKVIKLLENKSKL